MEVGEHRWKKAALAGRATLIPSVHEKVELQTLGSSYTPKNSATPLLVGEKFDLV